jgi:hypothetical protein
MLEHDPSLFIFKFPLYLVLKTYLLEQPEFVSLLNGDFAIPTSKKTGNTLMALFTDTDGKGGKLNVLDKGYDWQAASKRIEKALQEFKQSIADSK